MIYLVEDTGNYQARGEIQRIADQLSLRPITIDAEEITEQNLSDIMRSQSLFGSSELTVLRDLSFRSDLWQLAADWIPSIGDDTTLIFWESKPDKRTRNYKTIAGASKIITAVPLTERQSRQAEDWLTNLASAREVKISGRQIKDMVERATIYSDSSRERIIDQDMLAGAIDSLASINDSVGENTTVKITNDMITTVLPEPITGTVFDLLELALKRQTTELGQRFKSLSTLSDGYQVLAVVASQWSSLVVIALGDPADSRQIHPYMRSKLQALSRNIEIDQLGPFTRRLAELDVMTKSTSTKPWDALYSFLFELANRL